MTVARKKMINADCITFYKLLFLHDFYGSTVFIGGIVVLNCSFEWSIYQAKSLLSGGPVLNCHLLGIVFVFPNAGKPLNILVIAKYLLDKGSSLL